MRRQRVVVGMSIREASERGDLDAAAAVDGARVAFLQVGEPSLSTVLGELADDGVDHIELVGVAFGRLAPGNSWLRRIAAHWWRERGEGAPEVVVATSLAGPDVATPGVLDVAAAVTRPITGTEAGLTSSAWEHVPPYRHHVLACRGPRCSARGADATVDALTRGLRRRGMGDDEVLVTATGCLIPCNQAPVVVVHPDNVWYAAVDAVAVERVIDGHLVGGQPLPQRLRG